MQYLPLLLIAVTIVGLGGYFLLKILKYGGVKAALFGAPIEHTIGEVEAQGLKLMRIILRVHKLSTSDTDKAVALEITAKGFLSYNMTPVTLSLAQAQNLVDLLNQAVAEQTI